jgi:dihydroorotate dehydrogenase
MIDPMVSHALAEKVLQHSFPFPKVSDPHKVFGITFPNRVGLSAGWDKNGRCLKGLKSLGFGHVEIGTVTSAPHKGSPVKYVWKAGGSIVNRLGLPNDGARAIVDRVTHLKPEGLVVGVSISALKKSAWDTSTEDLKRVFLEVKDVADYVVINPSCPNSYSIMEETLSALEELASYGVPILIKMGLDQGALYHLKEIERRGGAGIVCSNSLGTSYGGLSGRAITQIGEDFLKEVKDRSSLPIISSGGVMTPDDALKRVELGADLVQVFSGFVYGGPLFPYRVARALKT